MSDLEDYQTPPGYGETIGAVTRWQRMDTAPRDGTPILACRDNGCDWDYYAVWWSAGDSEYPWGDDGGNGYPADRFDYWMPIKPPAIRKAHGDLLSA